VRRPVAILAAVLLACGCVGPVRSDRDFELKAANTAKAVASALETARLASEGAGRGKLTGSYVSVIVGEAETDATAAQSTFESYQPRSAAADKLRNDIDALVSDAVDGIVALRITARRGQLDRLATISKQLGPVSTALQQVQDKYG
jgi:hypothetical protein